MKESTTTNENVVLFPQLSKEGVREDNDAIQELLNEAELYSSESIDDPLEDLLNEFEDITTNMENEEAKSVLAKVVGKMKLPEELLAQEFSRSVDLKKKMRILEEVNQRIKYYLDEVELFIPKQKK